MLKRAIALFICMICLLSFSTAVSAQETEDIYYSKIGFVSEEYCDNMLSWANLEGISARPTSWGVRLSTKELAGASFFFPNQYDAKKTNWKGYTCAEISLTNETTFGVNVGFFITENPTVTPDDPVEQYQIKAGALGYLVDKDDKAAALMADDNGFLYIPGEFMGKVYIPLNQESLESVKWATLDGVLDTSKITGISYSVNTPKSSIIIGDVCKSKIELTSLASYEYEKSEQKEKVIKNTPGQTLAGAVLEGGKTAGAELQIGNTVYTAITVAGVLILITAAVLTVVFLKKRGKRVEKQ